MIIEPKILKSQKQLKRKTDKAAAFIFNNDFGKNAFNRAVTLAKRYNRIMQERHLPAIATTENVIGKEMKGVNVFDLMAEAATDIGIKDWARNHDHYLYGVEKRR